MRSDTGLLEKFGWSIARISTPSRSDGNCVCTSRSSRLTDLTSVWTLFRKSAISWLILSIISSNSLKV